VDWGEKEEYALRCALARRKNYVGVLLRYGYDYEDILQEMRLACLQVLAKHRGKGWQNNTLIDRAVHYRLMHLVRDEGKRARIYE